MDIERKQPRQWIAEQSAVFMFVFALVFLFCQAILVVLWADVPMLDRNSIGDLDPTSEQAKAISMKLTERALLQSSFQTITITLMLLVWPVIIAESIFHWCSRPWDSQHRKYHFLGLLFCICPSLRMCARSPEMAERIWLPGLQWRRVNKRLRVRLERNFSVPMIMIALLIMPVLVIEYFMQEQVAAHDWLRVSLHISTGLIWFAFAGEFILMFSIAEKKIEYCMRHWLDLAIILLPFISFMRSLRVLRATRAANLLRVSQISKFARIYRLRGTAVKALRALVLLELFQRLTGGPEKSIYRMELRLEELDAEAKEIRRKIRRLRNQIDSEEESGIEQVSE